MPWKENKKRRAFYVDRLRTGFSAARLKLTIRPSASPGLEAETGCGRRGWTKCWRRYSSLRPQGRFLCWPPPLIWSKTPTEDDSDLNVCCKTQKCTHGESETQSQTGFQWFSHLVQQVKSCHIRLLCVQELTGDFKQLLLFCLLKTWRI